jgi:hypothetical protein
MSKQDFMKMAIELKYCSDGKEISTFVHGRDFVLGRLDERLKFYLPFYRKVFRHDKGFQL